MTRSRKTARELPAPPPVEQTTHPAAAPQPEPPKKQPEPEPWPNFLGQHERLAIEATAADFRAMLEASHMTPERGKTAAAALEALARLLEAERIARDECDRLNTECARLMDLIHKRTNDDASRRPPSREQLAAGHVYAGEEPLEGLEALEAEGLAARAGKPEPANVAPDFAELARAFAYNEEQDRFDALDQELAELHEQLAEMRRERASAAGAAVTINVYGGRTDAR